MKEKIGKIVTALEELAAAMLSASEAYGSKTMREIWGWNCPPLTGSQVANMARQLARKIEMVPEEKVSEKFTPTAILNAISDFSANTLPYMWNGNASSAAPQYFGLLQWIELVFVQVYETKTDWERLAKDGLVPKQIATKLRTYNAQVKRFDLDFEKLGEKVEYINQAHEAAIALPVDLENVKSASEEAAESKAAAEKSRILAEAAREEIAQLVLSIQGSEDEARKLVENTADAYSAATTRGLGETFQKRAERLSRSMWFWVAALASALTIGAVLGHLRVESLQKVMASNPGSGVITLNMALAILSVAAPVWFAWLATKQIGHRFKLSEDYAFKASVAQAYEGYRREAARVDSEFAKRLFKSTLDRLDEAPIRFVENETFGSPWQELLNARASKKAEQTTNRIKPSQVANDDEGAANTSKAG